ncbi:hypothetical protein KPH14_001654 [Odynerus spinipes]|uniref:EGF-like domain-containing protein n=1 Tax=Odynerus spinipes TaxID=1348599 RepID=A0AAD9RZG3_9HYME|nr:hypothetical protein KPH14_001654 [Odynerus spinipes]
MLDQLCSKPLWFKCDNGQCVSFTFECDGADDCGDQSDEKDCSNFKFQLPPVNCTEDEFKCKDNTCIPIEKFCDAKDDCGDESDEYIGCLKHTKCKNFKCNDGHCVRNEWVCDGMQDCPDGSDELNCDGSHTPPSKCTNEIDRYLCKNDRCITLSQTCNKRDDCGDGSDEDVNACKKSEELCSHVEKCEQICRRTPKGPACSCQPGYKLINNLTCTDINECEIFGSCSQHCTNNAGRYVCSCDTGYSLQEDGKSCKADGGEALMFMTSRNDIRGYYIDSKIYYQIHTNLQYAVSVALDATYVYWSDIKTGEEAIFKSYLDGSSQRVIVSSGVDTPEDIAVDWVTGNIYFTDSGYQRIGVCDNNGTYCTVIVNERAEKPRAIVLSPKSGIMYWSDWGSKPHIAMASMDGKNNVPFVQENIAWPNGLTIDYPNNRLYWIDAKLKKIESIRLDGRDRRTILSDVIKRPYSLAVFENKLYWSEWSSNTIESCDKFTGKDWKTLLHANTVSYGIHIYHSVLQPEIPNPCSRSPCSQICLLNSNSSYTCACTLDKELGVDQHTCRVVKKREYIMIAAENILIGYYHELLGRPNMSTNQIMKHITALAYDSLTGGIFVSDQFTNHIYRYNMSTGVFNNILTVPNEMLGGMDFDFVGNNLYWTDMQHKSIEVHSLDTNSKTVFYFYEEPHDIVLIPAEGVMYVVLRTGDTYCINKMQMNGLGSRVRFVEENLLGPTISLAYDEETKRLYWTDQGAGRIQSILNTGKEKYLFRTGLAEPMSLAILGNNVFWTQKGSTNLYWGSKNTNLQNRKQKALRVRENIETMHLVTIHGTYYINDEYGCRKNNGNCSHVCLPTNIHDYICACPPGMTLNQDKRTCIAQFTCAEDEYKCSEHNSCIKLKQMCNGVADCPGGEDEADDCKLISLCDKNQFTCKNGECVGRESRCNSRYDCKDRSDEENCETPKCKADEFQCHEGGCISKYLVCNMDPDCADFSDETNCGSRTCGPDDFLCQSGECIPNSWVCDGESNCEDGSDEHENCMPKSCKEDMYKCNNNNCIGKLLLCNGFNDCGDNSDEDQCNIDGHLGQVNCTKDEYRCYNTNTCLPKIKRCNGVQDCPKNDDEHYCPMCQRDEFICDNNKCITQEWMCDKKDDCGDGSDEKYCSPEDTRTRNTVSSNNCEEFRCADGTCLTFDKVCNIEQDCADGSDEFKECARSCTLNNPCHNVCYKTPTGPVCGCGRGYRLAPDGVSCDDVNECEENVCSQMCHNTRGSFACFCESGYILQKDKISCKAAGSRMEIITVAGNDIRKSTPTLSFVEVIHHDPNLEVLGIDVNVKENAVYWSDDIVGTITKINLQNKEKKVIENIGNPGTIAVDWATNNVYFFNDERPYAIKACNMEQEKCVKVLTINGTSKVQTINVDPARGLLFWSQTDWHAHNGPRSAIYKSSMAGTNSTAIVTRNIGVVQKLTIENRKSRLYWCDTQLNVIESSNFDGSDRKVFLKTEFQPLNVNIYEDSIYWLISNTGNIKKCKLYGDASCTTIMGTQIVVKHFTILQDTKQPPVSNRCQDKKCAYMCLLNEQGSVCVCQDGRPSGTEIECKNNPNVKISSYVSSGQTKTNVRQDSGTITGICVTVFATMAILSAYCYYQQVKTSPTKKNDLSIHFQNPSYDQKSEVLTSFNCVVSTLPPGEHEYINPIINIKAKIDDPEKDTRKTIEVQYSDHSESEIEDSQYTANTKLLR